MNAREYMCFIGLNFHASATAISLLAAPEFPIDECLIDLQAGREA